jgi:hypothetical protein
MNHITVTIRVGDWRVEVDPTSAYYRTFFSFKEVGSIPSTIDCSEWDWFPRQWATWGKLRDRLESDTIRPTEEIQYEDMMKLHLAFLDLPPGWQQFVLFDNQEEQWVRSLMVSLGESRRSSPVLASNGLTSWRLLPSPIDTFSSIVRDLKRLIPMCDLYGILTRGGDPTTYIGQYTGPAADDLVGRLPSLRKAAVSSNPVCPDDFRTTLEELDGIWTNCVSSRVKIRVEHLPWKRLYSLLESWYNSTAIRYCRSRLSPMVLEPLNSDVLIGFCGISEREARTISKYEPTCGLEELMRTSRIIMAYKGPDIIEEAISTGEFAVYPVLYKMIIDNHDMYVDAELACHYTVKRFTSKEALEAESFRNKYRTADCWVAMVHLAIQALVRLTITGQDRDLEPDEYSKYNRRLGAAYWLVLGSNCRLYQYALEEASRNAESNKLSLKPILKEGLNCIQKWASGDTEDAKAVLDSMLPRCAEHIKMWTIRAARIQGVMESIVDRSEAGYGPPLETVTVKQLSDYFSTLDI